ncbi:MAG: hypothetical protein P1U74_01995 [Legionellaceae bacterium]|nr:hypothetical protein [Legionellaceae bacterium]
MSLINETLSNLENSRTKNMHSAKGRSGAVDDSGVLNPSSSRANSKHTATNKSSHNLLIVVISFGILISLLYVAYHFQLSQHLNSTKQYLTNKTAWLADNASTLRNKLTLTSARSPVNNRTHKPVERQPVEVVQIKYYNAMNLLNEGKEEQAKRDLMDILVDHPDFEPAKKAYAMLNAR